MRNILYFIFRYFQKRRRYFYNEIAGNGGRASFKERVQDFMRVADLRQDDSVLDVGCAEGLITLEIAPSVASVSAFDISQPRIEKARQLARERQINNVEFSCRNVSREEFDPMQFDVVLFLGVFEKTDGAEIVGFDVLQRLLNATKRHFVMRFNIEVAELANPGIYAQLFNMFKAGGFEPVFYSRVSNYGNLIVANREPSNYDPAGRLPFQLKPNS